MPKCGICERVRSRYWMNNKLVCFRCDELLFDIEIECDDEPATNERKRQTPKDVRLKVLKSPGDR